MTEHRDSREQDLGQKNYHLKSEAVERLADAEAGNVPEYSEEELKRYRSKKKLKFSDMAKVLFIKAWFPGAVCYFVLWGLGIYVGNMIDMLFILGAALGMVTDLLTNNVLRFMEKVPGEHDKWLLVTKKGVVGFVLNILAGIAIVVLVFFTYDFINRFVVTITQDPDNLFLGVEPIGYGLLCLGFDLLLIGMKKLGKNILRDAMKSAK